MKFIFTALMSVMLFGCAAKATTPTVQSQLDEFKVSVNADHTAMAERNTVQDDRLNAIEAKLDRVFRKGN